MNQRKTPLASAQAFFNPFPKYLQVRQVLERRMASEYELDQQIPTEQALRQEFGVSRETIREALRGLEQEGYIERHRPRGTFLVRRPDHAKTEKLTGLVEDLSALKLDTHVQLLSAGKVKATAETSLLSAAEDDVFCIRRLRAFDGSPLVLHEAFLPVSLGLRVARFKLGDASISSMLEDRLGLQCIEDSHQIEAMVADTELAQLLAIGIGAPVLLIRRALRLPGAGARVLFRSSYRADRYCYTLDLSPRRGATARKRAAR